MKSGTSAGEIGMYMFLFACGFKFLATVLLLNCFAERELLQHFPANS